MRIEPPSGIVLVDDPRLFAIEGCPPRGRVRVEAEIEIGRGLFSAQAEYEADRHGVVDPAQLPSLAGTYEGVDPFGLLWSGNPAGASSRAPFDPVLCRLRAETESGGDVAELALERRWLGEGVTIEHVSTDAVHGLFARPAGAGPFAGVVAFGGSGGGVGPAGPWAASLASNGIAVLAIAYFGGEGLPDALVNIEVEVVERAIAWLRRRPDMSAGPIGVMGQSRGSELALLAGVLLDDVGPVVMFAPSGVGWSGLGRSGPVAAPAWQFRGAAIPYVDGGMSARVPRNPDAPFALTPLFLAALRDEAAVRAAEIPVERIRGPILAVSGGLDAMWPSGVLTEIAESRARAHGFPHDFTHLHYPEAGHVLAGIPGTPVITETRHPVDGGYYAFGGTRAANAAARADSWPKVIDFLTTTLKA